LVEGLLELAREALAVGAERGEQAVGVHDASSRRKNRRQFILASPRLDSGCGR
jgi:hypothetical protein